MFQPGDELAPSILATPGRFFFLLGTLFAAHVLLRIAVSPVLEIDESSQVVLAQEFAWGYTVQPPLYTWLQAAFFKLFGVSILGLSLFKNLLLWSLYVFTYKAARTLGTAHLPAVCSTLGLLLIPQIAWESQRDLTHSVLLSTVTAATLWVFFRLADRRSLAGYAGLGLCCGLAILSKYSALLFLTAAAAAALCVPRYRAVLLDRRILLSIATLLAISAPHAVWAASHQATLLETTGKFHFARTGDWAFLLANAAFRLLRAFIPNLAVIAVLFLAGWRTGLLSFRGEAARFLGLWILIALGMALAGMWLTHATAVRGRWLQPLFVCTPVLLAAAFNLPPPRRWAKRLLIVCACITFAVGAGLVLRATHRVGDQSQNITTASLLELDRTAGDALRGCDVLVAESSYIGGNLRLQYGKPVITSERRRRVSADSQCVGIFHARHGPVLPKRFRNLLAETGCPLPPQTIEVTEVDCGMRLGIVGFEPAPECP